MENPLIFNNNTANSEFFFRVIIVLLSLIDLILVYFHLLTLGVNLSHVIISIILVLTIFSFFPRITYISFLQIRDGTASIGKWYNNKLLRKLKRKDVEIISFSLRTLEKLEIQHIGLFLNKGRINFVFDDQKKVNLDFTFTEITTQQFKLFKEFNPDIKIVETETSNNLGIIADYFSYGYDSSEFIQEDRRDYFLIIIIIILIFLPALLYLNLFI